MNIYTLNVSQGQFVVVTGATEALVIDTYVPPSGTSQETEHVKRALSHILANKHFSTLVVTGFDDDHFCEIGLKLVLNKYRPDWVMYPSYFKKTTTADKCFAAIYAFEQEKKFKKWSVLLDDNSKRTYSTGNEFSFEVFSPHKDDRSSSNNCSLVVKIKEKSTGATYLVTGDTELSRWGGIVKEFGAALKADVLAAAHHGSDNGAAAEALKHISPHTVLISAGVKNQYGHPGAGALKLLKQHSSAVYQTNEGTGKSWQTIVGANRVASTKEFVVP